MAGGCIVERVDENLTMIICTPRKITSGVRCI